MEIAKNQDFDGGGEIRRNYFPRMFKERNEESLGGGGWGEVGGGEGWKVSLITLRLTMGGPTKAYEPSCEP